MTDNNDISLFDNPEMMTLFMELHSGNPREGPGDDESTLKALRMITDRSDWQGRERKADILDVGCGPGMQTLCLAEATGGNITALDHFPQFLDQLTASADEQGLEKRITTVQGDMNDLPFETESFDLIWSEGAIYIMGFEKGLREWRKYLRPGGAIAVSQISWLRDDVSDTQKELFDWWMENCPDIRQVEENLAIIEACGYGVLGHFTLPESSWWDGYYASLPNGLERMRERYPDDEKVTALIQMEEEEQRMYREFSDYYGYEFYVMRKV